MGGCGGETDDSIQEKGGCCCCMHPPAHPPTMEHSMVRNTWPTTNVHKKLLNLPKKGIY